MAAASAGDRAGFEAQLGAVLEREIPGCRALISAERLSGGASQETYRITIDTADGARLLCMRRAPGGVTVAAEDRINPGLAVEAQLMRCARAAGVPEPEVHYVLEPGDGLGEGFVMQWLDGEALGARIVRSPELAALRPKLAYECGQIMARIHGIDLAAAGLAGKLQSATPEQFVRQTWERYQALETPQPMIDYAARWLLEHLPRNPRQTLVHNDFRNGNFMVDANGVVAVLDWEIAHVGDPMRDLGWICTNSWRFGGDKPVGGFGDYEDLFAGYESVSGTPVDPDHVKFWEVFGSFWWAVGCLGMAEHYRVGPDQTVERPAIGRRSSECQVDCVNLLIPGAVQLVEPEDLTLSQDMPRIDELLVSVRDYLREDVMAATQGRTNFLARVAGNSLDIVLRELAIGPRHRAAELARLRALFAVTTTTAPGELDALRWRLTRGLRDGSIALDRAGLAEHLRATVVNQIAIDQPKYSGFRSALERAG
ncbi:MAG: phosphotransferase family protein [Pseudomonadales bacterium]